jgi:uncharacterized protein YggT (Ycf19 family)
MMTHESNSMHVFFAVVHNMVMLIGLVFIAQGMVAAFNWSARQANPVYRLLQFLTSPVTKFARLVSPRAIEDRFMPLVAFMILFWLYVVLIFVRLYLKRPELFMGA